MAKEKQDKRFLQIFNRNKKPATVDSSKTQLEGTITTSLM